MTTRDHDRRRLRVFPLSLHRDVSGQGSPDSGRPAQYAQLWSTPDDSQWPQALAIRQQFIERWSKLINAPPGTLTTAENVTTALYSLIGSLPASYLEGRRVLVAADCFPSLHFLLAGLAEQHGFALETVPLRAGESWVRDEDFIAGWTADVGSP